MFEFSATHRAAPVEDDGQIERGAALLRKDTAFHFDLDDHFVFSSFLGQDGPVERSPDLNRTVSRLNEMRSAEYLALERREVDTSLT